MRFKLFLLSILLVLLSAGVFANELKIVNPDNNQIYLTVTYDQDSYYVDSDSTLKLSFDYDYTNTINNDDVVITANLYVVDTDDEEYFNIDDEYREFTLDPRESKKIYYDIEIDNSADNSDYDFVLEIDAEWDTNTAKKEIPVELKVDQLEDEMDISLSKTRFCIDNETFNTTLVFDNQSNDDYLVRNIELISEDFWPTVEDSSILVREDDKESIDVDFERKAVVGNYDVDLEVTLYKGGSNTDPKTKYRTTFKVNVEECAETQISLIANSSSKPDVKPNEPVYIGLIFKNGTNKELPVYFNAESEDKSLVLTTDPRTKIVPAFTSQSLSVTVIPTDSTAPGIKTIIVSALTSAGVTVRQTVYVNVISNAFDISYLVPTIKLGLKATVPIRVTYRGSKPATLTVRPVGSDDVVYIDKKNLRMNPEETIIITANIVPKSQGYKSFVLKFEGDNRFDKTIYYSVAGTSTIPVFVKAVNQNISAKKNANNILPIIVANNYDFDISIELSFEDYKNITSIPETVQLNNGDAKSINLKYFVGNLSVGEYTINLLTKSELGTTRIPIKINVVENLDNIQGLQITDIPQEIPYIPGRDITYKWSVSNLNGENISDATIEIVKGNEIIATRVFPIGANEIKEIDLTMNIKEKEDFVAKVILNAGNEQTSYDVVFTPNNSLITGLFSLGMTNVFGTILGLIVLVLIVVLVFTRKNNTETAKSPVDPKVYHPTIKKAM